MLGSQNNNHINFREWIQGSFRPVVLVSTTKSVESVCGKNNVNFIQLLKPFEHLQNIQSII